MTAVRVIGCDEQLGVYFGGVVEKHTNHRAWTSCGVVDAVVANEEPGGTVALDFDAGNG